MSLAFRLFRDSERADVERDHLVSQRKRSRRSG